MTMTKERKEQLEVSEIAITGFQLLLLAGVNGCILNGETDFTDEELEGIFNHLCLREDEELLFHMKKFTLQKAEMFVPDENEEKHPAMLFLEKVLSLVIDRQKKYATA